jgi:putative transposase
MRLYSISAGHYRYVRQCDPEDALINAALTALSEAYIRRKVGLMYLQLRDVQAKLSNHKRVYRIYCALRFEDQTAPRIRRDKPLALTSPSKLNVSTMVMQTCVACERDHLHSFASSAPLISQSLILVRG